MTVKNPVIDSLYAVETPEGIDLQADLAGPVVRILAYSIDIFIRFVILLVCGIALAFFDKAGQGGMLILMFLLEWFYPVVFEVCRKGQTPGKKQMGLAVVNDDLTPVSWGTSMVRNLLRFVDFLPAGYLLGLLSMVLNNRFARLGDLAAGTLVVYRTATPKRQSKPKANNLESENSDQPSQLPPFRLLLEEQRALVSFNLRQTQLTPARQQELVAILDAATANSVENTLQKNQCGLPYWQAVGAGLRGVKSAEVQR